MAESRRTGGNIQEEGAGMLLPCAVGYPIQAEPGATPALTFGENYIAATDGAGKVPIMPPEGNP